MQHLSSKYNTEKGALSRTS